VNEQFIVVDANPMISALLAQIAAFEQL